MSYVAEKDWTTASGLRAVVIVVLRSYGENHRCGYVGVPEGHPLYGKSYQAQLDIITKADTEKAICGDKSPMLLITAGVGADEEGMLRRSLDVVIDVHGGLTFSSTPEGRPNYPVESDLWWFGYDCAHYMDTLETCTLDFCVVECERLAAQLQEFGTRTEQKGSNP